MKDQSRIPVQSTACGGRIDQRFGCVARVHCTGNRFLNSHQTYMVVIDCLHYCLPLCSGPDGVTSHWRNVRSTAGRVVVNDCARHWSCGLDARSRRNAIWHEYEGYVRSGSYKLSSWSPPPPVPSYRQPRRATWARRCSRDNHATQEKRPTPYWYSIQSWRATHWSENAVPIATIRRQSTAKPGTQQEY